MVGSGVGPLLRSFLIKIYRDHQRLFSSKHRDEFIEVEISKMCLHCNRALYYKYI